MDGSDDSAQSQYKSEQEQRLLLMAELCTEATSIAQEAIARHEVPDMRWAFEQALVRCLMRNNYNKNDLVSVWAMLLVGERVIRRFCNKIDHYDLSPHTVWPSDNGPPPDNIWPTHPK